MTITKKELIQNIKWDMKAEYNIPYYHVDIIVEQMIEEIKKAIIRKDKIVIHGFMKFDTKIADEKSGIFLGRDYHCEKRIVGTVKLSESFQKTIKENSKVI
ncbi:HU family DNA-binding protein [Sulfurimonas sp.]